MEQSIDKRNSLLTKRIMRRVYLVAGIRTLLNPVFLKSLIIAVFFWRSTAVISYTHVFANAPSMLDIGSNLRFFRSALMHAEITTVMLLMAMGLLLAWVSFDMFSRRSHAWF